MKLLLKKWIPGFFIISMVFVVAVPIIVMSATFGEITAGGSFSTTNQLITGTVYNLPEDATISSITIERGNCSGPTSKTAIYDATDDSFVLESEEKVALSGTATIFTVSDETVLTAGDYWIVWWSDSSQFSCHKYHSDSSGETSIADFNTYGAWPASIPAHTNEPTRRYSIFATYTATGGGTATTTIMNADATVQFNSDATITFE